ncbi:LOW QUALITY PROTEIN: parapinopsin b [Triplophysa rosa]|uniref:LOW QUALITY PROTEIN: parapinopsin b n=1 Tax=Triplophysa rosa TaxID=992332 RepID=UPI00254625D7|nr:LOW QUALITY PROTEIN: parapinopsin b [Triplophysa rosa]
MASFPEVSNGSSVYGLGAKTPLPRAGFITLSVLMVLASVTSVVLNATVIAVTLRHKQLRQPLNFALVNLAVADLGTTLTGGLRSVVTNAVGYYIMGRVGCVLEGFCVALFGITALCTVALIAAERLFVVCKPLGTITFQSRHAAGGLELCWLWSLIWNTPPLLGWGSYQLEGVGTSCGPDWQGRDLKNVSYIICYFSLCFAVPFALIVISYSWLLYTLRQVAKVGRGAAARAESKVAWMVVMMVLAFLVSWLPCAALALTVVFNPEVQMSALVKVVPIYMAKSSTVYNPMIYIFMNKQFQRYAVPLLTCGKDPWPSEDDASELQTVVSPVNKISPE